MAEFGPDGGGRGVLWVKRDVSRARRIARTVGVAAIGVVATLCLVLASGHGWGSRRGGVPGGRTALFSWGTEGGGATQEALAELSFSGWGGKTLSLSGACGTCSQRVLATYQPWVASQRLDPEDALSCAVEGMCSAAAKRSAELAMEATAGGGGGEGGGGSGDEQLAERDAAHSARGNPMRMSKEQFAYDCQALDREQLYLNWRRARVFNLFVGRPSEGRTYTLAQWVSPVDPKGRPVPSWLRFTPTALSQFQMQSGGGATPAVHQQLAEAAVGGLKPLETVTPLTAQHDDSSPQSLFEACALETGCGGCAGRGCEWCGGEEVCSVKCAALPTVSIFRKAKECPAVPGAAGLSARAGGQASVAARQNENSQEIKSLVALSKMTAGESLVSASSAEDRRIEASHCLLPGQEGGPTLQAELDPLNEEQKSINRRRQMLYFRMETGMRPGQDLDRVDNFAKPTLAWSTIGRPWTGWLHWGNDNDGGYLSPAGGEDWDPSVASPAQDGGYGPATKAYIKKHPPPTSLVRGGQYDRAGSPLFGAEDPARTEALWRLGGGHAPLSAGAVAGGGFGSMSSVLGEATEVSARPMGNSRVRPHTQAGPP